jgi:hypothetical protein
MPLPVSDTQNQWPPAALDNILSSMARWSAWYDNDLSHLQRVYGGGISGDKSGFFASDTGGIKVHSIGPIRWFVGEAPNGTSRNTKLPVPIAAEMCQASADLLFSDPVTITVAAPKPTPTADADEAAKPKRENPTQVRLNELLDDKFHTTMAEAAEVGAALGGVYLRVTWDPITFPDGPFSTIKDADTAIPEFKFGRLQAVTFWTVVHRDGKNVYRHLERHELNAFGVGVILHGLYLGEEDRLGMQISLSMRPETAPLDVVQEGSLIAGMIDTKSPGLAVTYVPNQTPNRVWRTHAIGRHLGRSDLDGVEHLMDQLAETMSDWMRARRVARARIMLSNQLLKSAGPGQPAVANLDQEVYETINSLGGKDLTLEQQVQLLQPEFSPEGYKATADALIEQILQMAGYSMQTFGVQPDNGGDRTATEIESKERRSLMTRQRKIREWTPALREHVEKLLAVDRDFFGHKNVWTDLEVEFSDGVQESQLKLGQLVQALYVAEAASIRERVSIMHPDWQDDQIAREVALIQEEFAQAPMSDPMVPPFGDDDPADK